MALYSIENDTCLGITHSGCAVNVESEGYVELSDEEVAKILALLAFEMNRIEGRREYEELITNLLVFIDGERRRVR